MYMGANGAKLCARRKAQACDAAAVDESALHGGAHSSGLGARRCRGAPGFLSGGRQEGRGGFWGWALRGACLSGKTGDRLILLCRAGLAMAVRSSVGSSGCIGGLTVVPDTCRGQGGPQALLLFPASDSFAWGARHEGRSLVGDSGRAQLLSPQGRGGSRGDPRPHAALGAPVSSPTDSGQGPGL